MARTMKGQTPKELGYRMPAEWEPQDAVWISWPHNAITWEGILDKVENSYGQVVRALAAGQRVEVLVDNDEVEQRARECIAQHHDFSNVRIHRFPNVDTLIRDYGPTFVINDQESKLAMVKWRFNAWGDKYPDLFYDDGVPYDMNDLLQLPMFEAGINLEGGSIEVNGKGTLLTTEQCLLNPNRKNYRSKQELEILLSSYLNLAQVLWLKEGIVGDDTDGHIDDIARFVSPTRVLCVVEDDKSDENYAILKENRELLEGMVDQDGRKLDVVELPMPGVVADEDGKRLPASYANFYIGNSAVIVPVFGHKNDDKALNSIQHLFPSRKVVGIYCREMVYGLGTLHCCSQQQPSVGK